MKQTETEALIATQISTNYLNKLNWLTKNNR